MSRFFIFLCILLTLGFSDQAGVFYTGKTKLTAGNRTIEESRVGSQLGVSTGGVYRLETLFGLYTEMPNLIIVKRNYTVIYPSDYTGSTLNAAIVPGAQLSYVINLMNQANTTAANCLIEDIVPQHTHLYFTATPTLVGDCTNVSYVGVTANAGPGSAICFRFDLAPQGQATLNYTVTVD